MWAGRLSAPPARGGEVTPNRTSAADGVNTARGQSLSVLGHLRAADAAAGSPGLASPDPVSRLHRNMRMWTLQSTVGVVQDQPERTLRRNTLLTAHAHVHTHVHAHAHVHTQAHGVGTSQRSAHCIYRSRQK